MKYGNNPTRKQERQRRALARLPTMPDGLRFADEATKALMLERQAKERAVLEAAVADQDVANVRTKKDRTSRAKIGRNG